jgi:hypothetical protein
MLLVMVSIRSFCLVLACFLPVPGLPQPAPTDTLQLPQVGSAALRVVSPVLLELMLVTTDRPGSTQSEWNFVDDRGKCKLPPQTDFAVLADGKAVKVKETGFKRRVLYAPFKQRDLRVANWVYLALESPIPENATVEVNNPRRNLWGAAPKFKTVCDPRRLSPALHVNQTGYLPAEVKKGMVGYFLGSLGEMKLGAGSSVDGQKALDFAVVEAASGQQAFYGTLRHRPDRGFPYPAYQEVLEADFSALRTPGLYQLQVPGLGVSLPFRIGEDAVGAFARAYALGIYHQRCGTDNGFPFTRFTHKACHTARAEVPDMSPRFAAANESLAKESASCKDNPRHTAPQLKNVAAGLYPFVNRGPVDVSGGHHDAGDYSKYTINSAGFIHHLLFAADVFPGVQDLDNLGLPESGDGKSDVLQEVKWEADFLCKMQDADGGFYFLVYPREREYELDVLPDRGDPQIVFPKTTSVTAAATAALAQCASSPGFRKQFPEAAARCLDRARKGWAFLERAIAKFGKDGAYQRITHYGDEFMHDDELAWAACELYLATGEPPFQKRLLQWLNPEDPAIRKWGWWRLFDAYGCAIRSYAFGARAGKVKKQQLDHILLEQCENEIIASGEDQMRRAFNSAYGTSFPEETKRARAAGWYFSGDAAFDLAVAYQLDYPRMNDPRPKLMEALVSNLNYEQGCNPVNVTYLTGMGWCRQREIVHQFAQNDRRVLPPTGIPLGNIQAGLLWTDRYRDLPEKLSFPSDGAEDVPYPFYDRWSDAFNLSQEFVIVNQARALGYLAWLMAGTSLKQQAWKGAAARMVGTPGISPGSLRLESDGLNLDQARIVWELEGAEPSIRLQTGPPSASKAAWVEAEAQLPDGRRVFGLRENR